MNTTQTEAKWLPPGLPEWDLKYSVSGHDILERDRHWREEVFRLRSELARREEAEDVQQWIGKRVNLLDRDLPCIYTVEITAITETDFVGRYDIRKNFRGDFAASGSFDQGYCEILGPLAALGGRG